MSSIGVLPPSDITGDETFAQSMTALIGSDINIAGMATAHATTSPMRQLLQMILANRAAEMGTLSSFQLPVAAR